MNESERQESAPAKAAGEQDLLDFGSSVMGMVRTQVKEHGPDFTPCVFLWPGDSSYCRKHMHLSVTSILVLITPSTERSVHSAMPTHGAYISRLASSTPAVRLCYELMIAKMTSSLSVDILCLLPSSTSAALCRPSASQHCFAYHPVQVGILTSSAGALGKHTSRFHKFLAEKEVIPTTVSTKVSLSLP